jgi:hypothetical protein
LKKRSQDHDDLCNRSLLLGPTLAKNRKDRPPNVQARFSPENSARKAAPSIP